MNSTSVALRSVLSGVGISAMPCFEEDEHTNLVRVFPEPFYHQAAYIVYHESLRDSARIRVVVEGLLAFLHSNLEKLTGIKCN